MIIREWRGEAAPDRQDLYPEHFRLRLLPELLALPGFLGAELLKCDLIDRIEYTVLTRWTSMDAIRGFTGPDLTRAVIEPQAQAALLRFERTARHYEVVETTLPAP